MTKSNVLSWEKQILVFYVLNNCMKIIENQYFAGVKEND